MATFVDVKQADGYIKTKAVCRVWRDGKQVAKCKTFKTRIEAEEWAEEIEREMKGEVIEEQIKSVKPKKRKHLFEEIQTIGELQDVYHQAQAHISQLAKEPLILISVNTFTRYFEDRIKNGADRVMVDLEADLLFSMLRHLDQLTGRRDSNLVQMAITALRTRGLMD